MGISKLTDSHNFPKILEEPIILFNSNAFSPANQAAINSWFKTLPIRIAYALEYIYRSCILDPTYLLSLKAEIAKLLITPAKCVEILIKFRNELYGIEYAPEFMDIKEFLNFFDQVAGDFEDWKEIEIDDVSIYKSMNLNITPTGFVVGGISPDQTNR